MNAIMRSKPEYENEVELKLKFAELMLYSPNDPFEVARKLFPMDPHRSLWAQNHWPNDPIVQERQKTLLEEHGEDFFLPSQAETARLIFDRAQNSLDDNEYVKLMKLYADIRGFIQKPGINIDARQQMINPKIMVLPAPREELEWEAGLKEQQRKLIIDSTTGPKN